VLARTGGEGVDCVLNSLSGDCLQASLEVVRAYGHFCEIGKFDLQNNTHIGLKALECNVSYHAIDLATMFDHPRLSRRLHAILTELLDAGLVEPLPSETFKASHMAEALRFLSAGKHRGKVLVEMKAFTPILAVPRLVVRGTHIITGGTGGVGLELARWLLDRGAERVVLVSRSGLRTAWQQWRHSPYAEKGCVLSSRNVALLCEAKALLEEHHNVNGSMVRGIWHAAGIIRDGLFEKMSEESWESVNSIKVDGLKHLHEAASALSLELDAFVMFSSVSSLQGNLGQSNYAHANAAAEQLILSRNAEGMPGVAIQWGPIAGVGMLAHVGEVGDLAGGGVDLQHIDDTLSSLDALVPHGGVVSSYLQRKKRMAGGEGVEVGAGAITIDVEVVTAKVAEVLGGDAMDYDADRPMSEYGLDSLASIELVNWINAHVRVKATPAFMSSQQTIAGICKYMVDNQLDATGASKHVGPEPVPTAAIPAA